MLSFLKYTAYLIAFLFCLFLLEKMDVDVREGFVRAYDRVSMFARSIADAPEKKDNTLVESVLQAGPSVQIGAQASSSSISYASTSSIKGVSQSQNSTSKPMSIAGILQYTNIERTSRGLSPLTLNKKLSNSALVKVEDMFDLEYFEHTSPSGKTAADLVRAQGYDFQSVGENLALGEFGTDKKLVEAWMNSPSHRKNILNPKFTELGLAVARATYKGEVQWLSVQHFAKPAPVCDAVPSDIKQKIDTEKNALEVMEVEIKKMAEDIESDPGQNKGVDFLNTYNTKVAEYNARLATLRDIIRDYNIRIEAYNTCLVS